MSNLPLDARVVLIHLNALGYRNITSEQLKEFIKDLKKLIKYDLKMEAQGFRVALKTTVSSRSKSREKAKSSSSTENEDYFIKRRFDGIRRSRSSGKQKSISVPKKISEKQSDSNDKENQGKASDRSRSPRNPSVKSEATKATKPSSRSKSPKDASEEIRKKILEDSENTEIQKPKEGNQEARPSRPSARSDGSGKVSKGCKIYLILEVFLLIRFFFPGIRPNKPQKPAHGDPVALYQYYKKEWEKFKPCFPGENSWTDLRWEIRNKLKSQH